MAYTEISAVESGIQNKLRSMLTRAGALESFLNKNLFQQVQQAQIERWMTENTSQGTRWKDLNDQYRKRKLKKFASYAGAGNAKMVATGSLASGAQGRDPANFYKMVTPTAFIFGINLASLPYAVYPGRTRPYMQFSKSTIADWKRQITRYIGKGI